MMFEAPTSSELQQPRPAPAVTTLLTRGVDAFATATSFLSALELVRLRQVSKSMCTAVDHDVVWAKLVQDQLLMTRVVPQFASKQQPPSSSHPQSSFMGGGSVTTWRTFVQRNHLHIPSNLLNDPNTLDEDKIALRRTLGTLGRWLTVASVAPTTTGATTPSKATFHAGATALVDLLAAPRVFASKQQTATVGIILTDSSCSSSSRSTVMPSVQQQVLDFLQLTTSVRMEDLIDDLLAKPVSESIASIEVFNATPHGRVGGGGGGVAQHAAQHRMVFVLRTTPEARSNPAGVGALIEAMMNVCSSVQFVGENPAQIAQFCNWFGSTMATVPAAPFSTGANTPSIAFTTAAACSDGSSPMDLTSLIAQNSEELNSWMLNRSCSIGVGVLAHKTLCSLSKPLHCPAWANPAVSTTPSPSTVLRMLQGCLEERNAWSLNVMKYHCGPEEMTIRSFYDNAIRTEFEHHTRSSSVDGAYLLDIPTPMNPLLMVEAHNLYFYAALRKYGYGLHTSCGRDSEAGMKLLEVLKRNVSECFRFYWRRNNEFSRTQCHAVFDHTFNPIAAKFYQADSSPLLRDRRGLQQWYTTVSDKILEYELKAKGLRCFDILSEELEARILPELVQFLQNENQRRRVNGESIVTHEPDAERAVADIKKFVIERTALYNRTTDGTLNKSQHESALYTAAMSNELASMQSKSAVHFLVSIEEDAEAWEQSCLFRIRTLMSKPRASKSAADSESVTTATNGGRLGQLTSDGSSLAADEERSELDEYDVDVDANNDNDNITRVDYTSHSGQDDDDAVLTRCAENRGQMISEAMAEEQERRTAATRLQSRLDQQRSVFDVVARDGRSGGLSRFSRMRNALRQLMN